MAITIPGLPAASAAQLTDLIEVSQGGVSKKETLQQVLDLFKNQGAPIAATGGITYQAILGNNKGLIYYPSSILPLTLTLPTNAQDSTLPAGYFCYAMNPPGNSENLTISTTDTAIGSTTVLPGSIALIFKSIYGAPNTWVITQMPMSYPLSVAFGGTGAGNLTSVQTSFQIIGAQDYVSIKEITPLTTGAQKTPVEVGGVTFTPFALLNSGTTIAEYDIQMPKRYNLGTISGSLSCFTPATSGTAVVSVSAAYINSGDNLAALTFSSATNINVAATATANSEIKVSFSGLTPGGTASANCRIMLRISRAGFGGSDTLNNTLYLDQFTPIYTANVGNDA